MAHAKKGFVRPLDPSFREFWMENYDEENRGNINLEDALSIIELDCSEEYIEDLYGIDCFENLEYLDCSYNEIVYAVFRNPKLKYLEIQKNFLREIDVKGCPELKVLRMQYNPTLSDGRFIDLHNNLKLSEIDVSGCGNIDLVIPALIENSVSIIDDGDGVVNIYRWDDYWANYDVNIRNPHLSKPEPIMC